jgi:glycine oxidase
MRVAVVGAGIVGLACAEELLRGGHEVQVFDPAPAAGATHAAAGMLAPAGEAWHGDERLLRLGLASARLWPGYAARLHGATGVDVDLRTTGTLLVGCDRDDLQVVNRTLDVLRDQDVDFESLEGRALRRLEPTLSGRVTGGALLRKDHNVNPRLVARALQQLLGNHLVRRAAHAVEGGLLLDDGTRVDADIVVLATGAGSRTPWVRPVKGEIVRVRGGDPPARVLRARVRGDVVYVVPRAGNEMVIGATEEEHRGDPRPTVGGLTRLLTAARALVPSLETAEILEVLARNRPGTPDNGPLIGPDPTGPADSRRLLATGHYRGGVLLAPLTALAVRAYVEGSAVPVEARPFTPDRFTTPGATPVRCPQPRRFSHR